MKGIRMQRILSALRPSADLAQDLTSLAAVAVFTAGVSLFGSGIAAAVIAWSQP